MTNEPDEPLGLSAPLAWRLAAELCREDPATGERCTSYHGLWQVLRIMKLIEPVQSHAPFFHRAVAAVQGDRRAPRILVSGAADYSMLAHVLAAFRSRGVEPAVTVLDLCETPLALNRWYAERAAFRLETTRDDVLDYRADGPFDAICTHAFLGRFSPEQRLTLLAKWRSLLRPGGAVITVTPVRPGSSGELVGFAPEQVRMLRETVLRAAEGLRETLQIEPLDLARAAEVYAGRHRVYPVRSHEALRELFERSGFRVDHFSRTAPSTGASHDVRGPTIFGSAEYACIAATRPTGGSGEQEAERGRLGPA
jgi:SAM-dependent methyltransferase